ncbi:MAG TPA: tetratricopeptide repeat protein [Isosphaeraceae bacterium]|nr:tetratricopeptide repeat protein [Isosphaeraceae bacterium]
MTRNWTILVLTCPTVALSGGSALARGFGGGGFRGGGGVRAGGSGGFRGGEMGGFRGGEMGGMRSGGAEGFRGGYGGASSFGRTPSFSSAGTFDRGGGEFRGYNPYAGGGMATGARTGSDTTARGGTIDYGAAGRGVVGPGGGMAGRGVAGAQVTTAGGRTFTDVGRAGGAVGPAGNAVGGRSNVAAAAGPRGTAVAGSRGGFAAGPGGVVAGGERGRAAVGAGGAAVGSRGGAAGYRAYGNNAYGAYHAGWVHGYWNGHNNAAWAWRGPYWGGWGWGMGLGLGMGLGYGLASWGYGSALYGMGYLPYSNPYYAAPVAFVDQSAAAVPYDYAQPIDTTTAPAGDAVADPAIATFDAARDSFKQGNYTQALAQANDALAKLPNDTALHEFRALCQFALKQYEAAAATLYAVLSIGPGWDWPTLVSLYPDVNVYTAQLRALEDSCAANPNSAAARFVLSYHYLTEGYIDAAVSVLKQVVALMPSDTLSAKLLRQLDVPKDQTTTATAPEPAPVDTTPPQGASMAGTWKAHPTADTEIGLTIQPGGQFTWQVNQKGKAQHFTGTSTYGAGILTLVQDKGPPLVGRLSWKDAEHMTFRVAGDGPDDPGLSFSR